MTKVFFFLHPEKQNRFLAKEKTNLIQSIEAFTVIAFCSVRNNLTLNEKSLLDVILKTYVYLELIPCMCFL